MADENEPQQYVEFSAPSDFARSSVTVMTLYPLRRYGLLVVLPNLAAELKHATDQLRG